MHPSILKIVGGNNLRILEIENCSQTGPLNLSFFLPSAPTGEEEKEGKEKEKEKEKEGRDIHHFSQLHTLKIWDYDESHEENSEPTDTF